MQEGQLNMAADVPKGVLCLASPSGRQHYNCVMAFPLEGDLRLTGGATPIEGCLEVYDNDTGGGACTPNGSSDTARVVCRQLGFAETANGHFGTGGGLAWLKYVRSSPAPSVAVGGAASRLTDCTFFGWGQHNCGDSLPSRRHQTTRSR